MTTSHRASFLLVTTGVLGVLLGACSGGADPAPAAPAPLPAAAPRTAPGLPPSAGQPMSSPQPVSFPHSELDADDQFGDGARVLIEETELPVTGHVAVYDQAGTVLGSAPVRPGAHRGAAVTLEPALRKGTHSLRAVLTVDDGDGKYDPAHDAPVRDDGTDNDLEDDQFLYTVG
ncbi:DUF7282 domain-containing protein [Amycolatopsis anabasis]|uniref:DUF7282 domain-containing protein n=1 Tax=Amycolatopsis anabasis TaxID=1840409 RepID=UPI00131E5218|nr:hypothetical protein [Amycolatopsis anabasis]